MYEYDALRRIEEELTDDSSEKAQRINEIIANLVIDHKAIDYVERVSKSS